jgi:predicted TIM-barrel fold metal-dependent hydrolase
MSLYGISEEFSDVKIVMAHSGMLVFSGNAAKILAARPNVYGDSTWTPGFLVRDWTRAFGPRIMFASDHADNAPAEIEKIKTCGLTEQEQRQVFADTAVSVFNLKNRRKA